MATSKKQEKNEGGNRSYDDIFRVVISLSGVEALTRIQKKYPMDAGHVKVDPKDKTLEAEVYITEEQIARLKKLKLDFKVHENMSAVGRIRQKEVGKGDRFKNGTIAPKGLGKKIKN